MKHLVLTAIVFLLLGAIVNVAVAWGCELWGADFPVFDRTVAASAPGGWYRPVRAHWPSPDRIVGSQVFGRTAISAKRVASQPEIVGAYVQLVLQAGLPFRGMESERRQIPADVLTGGTEYLCDVGAAPKWLVTSPRLARRLPTRPIWPGFAINTVLYAAVLWGGSLLFVAAPFALRRWRRIKRGLCPKCAYPVGTSEVCTECGAAVTRSRKAVAS